MRWTLIVLMVCLLGLQYRLWIGPGSWEEITSLQREIAEQRATNERLNHRNHILEVEIQDLKGGLGSVEARARSELGFIKQGETFFILAHKP